MNVSTTRTVVPTANDVILGRGVLHAHHPGNKRFYAIIDKYVSHYEAAESRTEKTRIVQHIYQTITSLGRFVKDDVASAACVVIEATAAKKKISHAIRFRSQTKKSQCSISSKLDKTSSSITVDLLPDPTLSTKNESLTTELESEKTHSQGSLLAHCQTSCKERRNRSSSVDSISIFPDEELESVLLPVEDLTMARIIYEQIILRDPLELSPTSQQSALKDTTHIDKCP